MGTPALPGRRTGSCSSDLRLYDAAIGGTADHLMAHAFCGDFATPCLQLVFGGSSAYLDHFRRWAASRVGHASAAGWGTSLARRSTSGTARR